MALPRRPSTLPGRLPVVAAVVAVGLGLFLLCGLAGASAAQSGTIATVAGTGSDAHTGDGGEAISAAIDHPRGIAVLPDGGFLFAEPFANTVRRVSADGTITTVAGTGKRGFSGDGGPATQAELDLPHGVALLPGRGFVVADAVNNRIRRVAADGTITTLAGTGVHGFSGDGGPAPEAELGSPHGVATFPDGSVLIPDTDSSRVRLVSPSGVITTVAGTGVAGYSGDGGPATAAELDLPFGVATLSRGGFLVAERNRVRRVSPAGTITTVAGTGVAGYSGDGGPATAAELSHPHNVAALPDGGFLIADTDNNRIRRVWPSGLITTVAGTGTPGFAGDGGPATQAELDQPKAVAVKAGDTGFLVADSLNNRIRSVSSDLRAPFRVSLASRRLRVRAARLFSVVYRVTAPAALVLRVRRGSSVVARRSLRAPAPGRGELRLQAPLRPGRYALVLTATAGDARTARAVGSLTIVP